MAVGGSFKSGYKERTAPLCCYLSLHAPRGMRRKTRISERPLCRLDLNDPPTAVGGIQRRSQAAFVCRLDLNDPPTAVGGIRRRSQAAFVRRLDLNDPPTAVGGIQRSSQPPSFVGWT